MLKTTVAACAIALAGSAASAAIVSLDTTLPTPDASGVAAPTSTTGIVVLNAVGNDFDGTPPNARSPWDGTIYEATGKYNSVSTNSSATYDYGGQRDMFHVMWGSPDDYNKLSFYDGATLVFSLLGTDVDNPPAPGTGFVNVTVTDLLFTKVVFESFGQDAFEFADVTPVPLPASLGFLMAGIGGIAVAARRRKSA